MQTSLMVDGFVALLLAFVYLIILLIFEWIRDTHKKPLNSFIVIPAIVVLTIVIFFFSFVIRVSLDINIRGYLKQPVMPINIFSFLVFFYGIRKWYKALKEPIEGNEDEYKNTENEPEEKLNNYSCVENGRNISNDALPKITSTEMEEIGKKTGERDMRESSEVDKICWILLPFVSVVSFVVSIFFLYHIVGWIDDNTFRNDKMIILLYGVCWFISTYIYIASGFIMAPYNKQNTLLILTWIGILGSFCLFFIVGNITNKASIAFVISLSVFSGCVASNIICKKFV